MKKKVETEKAPKAIGPYSQGIKVESQRELLFVSGQLPIDPKSGKLIEGGIGILTNQVLNNIEAILEAGGSSLQKVLRVDIFLKDLKRDFSSMNEEYSKRFTGIAPARQTVQVADLPLESPIEISCVAYV